MVGEEQYDQCFEVASFRTSQGIMGYFLSKEGATLLMESKHNDSQHQHSF